MKNKNIRIAIYSIIALVLVTIGITYAYWLVTKNQTGNNVISTGCLDISLTDEENDISLTNQYPISDIDAAELVPYSFTIKNNCQNNIVYQLAIESMLNTEESIIADAIKISLREKGQDDLKPFILSQKELVEPQIEDAQQAYKLLTEVLEPQGSASFDLRIWLDENAPISEMKKTFESKISATTGYDIGTKLEEGTLAYEIISNYGDASTIPVISEYGDVTTGLYKTYDNLGESYYFRGNPEDNYVIFGEFTEDYHGWVGVGFEEVSGTFASEEECLSVSGRPWSECMNIGGDKGEPIYWRIVRVNGDGSIRLVYFGNKIGNSYTSLGFTMYNDLPEHQSTEEEIKKVGYTYDVNGVETDSVVKSKVDEWYNSNLKTNYEKYLADSIFCNDRTRYNEKYYDADYQEITNKNFAKFIAIDFGAYKRISEQKPSLICPNRNDRYSIDGIIGNGNLTNPVGLLTADEVYLSGSFNNTYLPSSTSWTMSPGYASPDTGLISAYQFNFSEYLLFTETAATWISYNENATINPVINLKADVNFTGTGEIDSPYQIVME